jgi:colicin import membrane protein
MTERHNRQTRARPIRPPRERGTWKAFALAALMHLLLGWLLYHGINWQNNTPAGSEAELWTEVPDLSTPRPVPPPPAPVKVQPAPPPAKDEEADIALQEKKRKQQEAAAHEAQLAEQRRQQQQAQQEAEAKHQQQLAAQQAAAVAAQKAAQDKQKQVEKQKQLDQQKLDQQKQAQQQQKVQQDKEAEQQKEAKEKADAQAKAKADADAKAKAKSDAAAKAKLDSERRARLAQLQGQAGGGSNESGEGLAKSGTGKGAGGNATSPGYAEKVQRRVRPNIVWSGETAGLETVVTVRCAPSGTLLSSTVTRSSGNDQWDEAALRAVRRSDPMPVDINGQAPSSFTITLRPAGG